MKCLHCDKVFARKKGRSRPQLFCKPSCQKKHWKKNNKEKVRQHQQNYKPKRRLAYAKRRAHYVNYKRRWREENYERYVASTRAWQQKNKVKLAAYMRDFRNKNPEYRKREIQLTLLWNKNNPERRAATVKQVRIREVRELKNNYVKAKLCFKTSLKHKDIPDELVVAKREHLLAVRTVRNFITERRAV